MLYQLVQAHLESFLLHVKDECDKRLPKYVESEFRRYLECGQLAHGFARALCSGCGHELLLPFSCKLRGICPSCNARRTSNTAAHLVDHVIPDVPLRQWVLTVPFELRLLLAAKPDALSAVGRIFVQEIHRWQKGRRANRGRRIECAAVSFCQRFGSSLNLNVHWHVVVPDVLFSPSADQERPDAIPLRGPTRMDLEEVVTATATRVVRWLEKHGYLGDDRSGEEVRSPLLQCLRGCLGVGPLHRAGPSESGDQTAPTPPPKPRKGLAAEYLRFNLHAAVTVGPGLVAARERLLRYCARAPLALERLELTEDGNVSYRVKQTEQVRIMTPLQSMARLSALIPPPRHPLVRFYGVFAPHSRWRHHLGCHHGRAETTHRACQHPRDDHSDAPTAPRVEDPGTTSEKARGASETPSTPSDSRRPTNPTAAAVLRGGETPTTRHVEENCASRIDWATLLKRVFDVDALECPSCGQRMRFVETVDSRAEASLWLRARNLPDTPPPLGRARSPHLPYG